jgi:hypothetical protein
MRYDLCGIYSEQFEQVVAGICTEILCSVVQFYAPGRDGGRDAYYNGYSDQFKKEGKHVIQAKHTNNPVASFSDGDFLGNQSSIIREEIPKIRALVEQQRLDFYMLFSNRKLTSQVAYEITELIAKETSLPESSILLYGIEMIQDYLKDNVDLPRKYNIDFFYSPLTFVPDELAQIIQGFSKVLPTLKSLGNNDSLLYLELPQKNLLNDLSQDYFKYIQETAFSVFGSIDQYLNDPINDEYRSMYLESTDHLQQKVLSELAKGSCMDEILSAIYENLLHGDSYLGKNKKLTRSFLYYMYCACDIGKKL